MAEMTDTGPDTGAARRALDKFKKLESQVSKMEPCHPCSGPSWLLSGL